MESDGSEGSQVPIAQKQIAWASDITYKFKNMKENLPTGKDWKDVQWLDMEGDEHFIVWMRTAGLPNFRKLWGRIEDGMEPGDYMLKIDN